MRNPLWKQSILNYVFLDPHINVLYTSTVEQNTSVNFNLTDLHLNTKHKVIMIALHAVHLMNIKYFKSCVFLPLY